MISRCYMQMLAGAMLVLLMSNSPTAFAQDFEITWFSIDGGGGVAAGGDFALTSTIAQPEAGTLTGGDFTLTGGFMAALAAGCACPADLTGDGQRDGADIPAFVDCFLSTGTNCACADLDGNGILGMADLTLFVDSLLIGDPCS